MKLVHILENYIICVFDNRRILINIILLDCRVLLRYFVLPFIYMVIFFLLKYNCSFWGLFTFIFNCENQFYK